MAVYVQGSQFCGWRLWLKLLFLNHYEHLSNMIKMYWQMCSGIFSACVVIHAPHKATIWRLASVKIQGNFGEFPSAWSMVMLELIAATVVMFRWSVNSFTVLRCGTVSRQSHASFPFSDNCVPSSQNLTSLLRFGDVSLFVRFHSDLIWPCWLGDWRAIRSVNCRNNSQDFPFEDSPNPNRD